MVIHIYCIQTGIIGTLQRFDQVQYHGGVTGQDWRNYPKKSRGELTPAYLISKQVDHSLLSKRPHSMNVIQEKQFSFLTKSFLEKRNMFCFNRMI